MCDDACVVERSDAAKRSLKIPAGAANVFVGAEVAFCCRLHALPDTRKCLKCLKLVRCSSWVTFNLDSFFGAGIQKKDLALHL